MVERDRTPAARRCPATADRPHRPRPGRTPLRLVGHPSGASRRVRAPRRMTPMRAPRWGLLLATLASLALTVLVALSSGTALDTAAIDLRHRWVALTAPTTGPDPDD